MGNYLIVWPKSEDVVHINYHYTQFGEVVDYLINMLKVVLVQLIVMYRT